MSALVAIGILEADDSLVDAALSEIQGLPLDKRNELDPGRIVSKLLIQNHLAQVRVYLQSCIAYSELFARDERGRLLLKLNGPCTENLWMISHEKL